MVSKNNQAKDLVSMTPAAAEHFKKIMENESVLAVRLTVDTKGCAGLKYRTEPTNTISESDIRVERDGAVLLIAEKDQEYYTGTVLDYITEGLNRRLVFNNPSAENVCGCGESFMIGKKPR